MGVPAFHPRHAIGCSISGQILGETSQQFASKVSVRNLAPAELYDGLHSISFLQKPDCVILFEIVVVIVGIGAEFQLLDLYDMLLLFRLMRFLFHLVLVVSVIDRLGDRRHRRWRHNDQIQPQLLRFSDRGCGWHYFGCSVWKYGPDFFGPYRFIHIFSAIGLARREVAAWNHALKLFTSMTLSVLCEAVKVNRALSQAFSVVVFEDVLLNPHIEWNGCRDSA